MLQRIFFRLTAFALAMSAMIILITGCGRSAAQQRPPPPSVTVASVAQQEIVEWDEFTGRTEAVEMVDVRPRVFGPHSGGAISVGAVGEER